MGAHPFWQIHKEKMKCTTCNKKMKHTKNISFNESAIDGWKCTCGETYYNPEQAQHILLLNKLKKEKITAKLGQIRSNLILRLPKNIEKALHLHKGEKVILQVKDKELIITPV